MPCENESDTDSTDDFVEQLCIDDLINNNCDCHVIVGGDLNVGLSRGRPLLLKRFCENLGLRVILGHLRCTIDYSYDFDSERFIVLHHFLLSGIIFENWLSARTLFMTRTIHLTLHDPIFVRLFLD
jgi:hypothetical protein